MAQKSEMPSGCRCELETRLCIHFLHYRKTHPLEPLPQNKPLDVVFYMMSREVWRSKKPLDAPYSVCGPVRMSGDFQLASNLASYSLKNSADHTTALPQTKELRVLGNRVFETAQSPTSTQKAPGAIETLKPGFKVVAVPVRASDGRCVNCHNDFNGFEAVKRTEKSSSTPRWVSRFTLTSSWSKRAILELARSGL